jgi:hypothetical protein
MLHFIYQVIAQRRESLKEMLDDDGQDVETGPSNQQVNQNWRFI